MRDSLKIALGIILGCAGIAAVIGCGFLAVTLFLGGLVIPPRESELQTVSPIGEIASFDEFEVVVDGYEFSGEYETEFTSNIEPPEGAKFVWIHIRVRNLGETAEYSLSQITDLKLAYLDEELTSKRGNREGYPDYAGGIFTGEKLYPGVELDGWLRFTVPVAAQEEDLEFVLKPWLSGGEHRWRLTK